jgi:hypothetical protein
MSVPVVMAKGLPPLGWRYKPEDCEIDVPPHQRSRFLEWSNVIVYGQFVRNAVNVQ